MTLAAMLAAGGVLLSPHRSSAAELMTCVRDGMSAAARGWTKFRTERKEEGPIRWVHKNKGPGEAREEGPLLGVLAEPPSNPGPFDRISPQRAVRLASRYFYDGKSYHLEPVDRAVRALELRTLPENREFTFPARAVVTSPVVLLAAKYGALPLVAGGLNLVADWIRGKSEERETRRLLDEDYRYAWIRRQLLSKKWSLTKAVQEAGLQRVYLQAYYDYLTELDREGRKADGKPLNYDSPAASFELLHGELGREFRQYVFLSLKEVTGGAADGGPDFWHDPDFEHSRPKPVVPEEVFELEHRLLQLEHDKLYLLKNVRSWLEKSAVEPADPNAKALFHGLLQDDYVRELIALRDRGCISQSKLAFRVMEDIDWKTRFAIWEATGSELVLPDENGLKVRVKPGHMRAFHRAELKAELGAGSSSCQIR